MSGSTSRFLVPVFLLLLFSSCFVLLQARDLQDTGHGSEEEEDTAALRMIARRLRGVGAGGGGRSFGGGRSIVRGRGSSRGGYGTAVAGGGAVHRNVKSAAAAAATPRLAPAAVVALGLAFLI